VLAHRGGHFGLQFADVLGNGHWNTPDTGYAGQSLARLSSHG
jgi:hypothetical protein